MRFEYRTNGTCSQKIIFDLNGETVTNVQVIGGCNGNLKGIANLIDGMSVDEIYTKLVNIRCQSKPTSCPDQIALAVKAAYEEYR